MNKRNTPEKPGGLEEEKKRKKNPQRIEMPTNEQGSDAEQQKEPEKKEREPSPLEPG